MAPIRHRSSKTNAEWCDIYAQKAEEREAQSLTARQGAPIFRSHAAARFSEFITRRDLDSILPVSREQNPRGGIDDVVEYNLCDVVDLVNRLKPTFLPDELTRKDPGWDVLRSVAETEFGINRIRPCKKKVNTHPNARSKYMLMYNRKDLVALKVKIEAVAAAPTGLPILMDKDLAHEVAATEPTRLEGASHEQKPHKTEN